MDSQRDRIAAVTRLGTGPLSDAMEQLRLPRTVVTGWRFVTADPLQALVGSAFTLRQGPKARSLDHDHNGTRQGEVAAQLAQPGDVIIIDAGGRTDIATWGETYSVQAKSRGIAGLVINGALRDTARVRRVGFPVLCRGYAPVASRWDLTTVAVNEPLSFGGVIIRPGDLVYGDDDGLLVIPIEQIPAVFDRALAIVRTEETIRAAHRESPRMEASRE